MDSFNTTGDGCAGDEEGGVFVQNELTRMRVPGCKTGLIPGRKITLGKNREISGSPLGISQPNTFPSN